MDSKLNDLKDQMTEIKTDVSEIKTDIGEVNVTLAVLTESVVHHVKRTDALQDMVEEFKTHMTVINTAIRVILAIGGLILALDQLGFLKRIL